MNTLIRIYNNFLLPTALLSGLIIGAGVFTLPYVFERSGFSLGLLYLFIFGSCAILIHLMYAEVIIKTKERHRLLGYARLYLGEKGFWAALFLNILGNILVLGVFLILSISFFNLIAPWSLGFKMLIVWAFGSFFILTSSRVLAEMELVLNDALLLGALTIFLLVVNRSFFVFHELRGFDLGALWVPFGPVLFSLLGLQAIPLLVDYFRDAKKGGRNHSVWIKRSIVWGTSIPLFIYILFVVAIMISSDTVSEDAVSGLFNGVSVPVLFIFGLFGLLNLRSSYTIVGRDLRDSFIYDLKWKEGAADYAVLFLPLIVYTIFKDSLLGLVSFVGDVIVMGYLVLVVLIWFRVREKNPQPIFS